MIRFTREDFARETGGFVTRKTKLGYKSRYDKFSIPKKIFVEGYGEARYNFSEDRSLTGKAFFYKGDDFNVIFW